MSRPVVGVLALQGDVAEHLRVLSGLGAIAQPVRRAAEIAALDGIVIPGGESTTMSRLLDVFDVRETLESRLRAGLPAYGSCAGMIMLATDILDGRADQRPLGVLDVSVRRNAFGRQVDSFETDLDIEGWAEPVRAVFIRAPWVERVGAQVHVLAAVGAHPVAIRQGPYLATSFHPEVTGDHRFHRLFLDMVGQSVVS